VSVLGRLARLLHPGVRQVHAQVARYAAAWEQANARAQGGAGPLWVVLGDSTAQGIGAPAWNEGYVGQLLAGLDDGAERPWRVLNLSKSGARTTDVLDRQLPALHALAATPDLVTCSIGANDIVGRVPVATFEARLRAILARLPPGAIVATVPQGLNRMRTEAANRLIRAEGPAAGLVVADWAAAFAEVLPLALELRPEEPRQPPHRLGSSEPQ
jgi:lysophospholipase L1-like esterase